MADFCLLILPRAAIFLIFDRQGYSLTATNS